MKKLSRRSFLAGTGLGLGLTGMNAAKLFAGEARWQWPIILCSRGEQWGRKVLEPAWQILQQGGSILDALEKGANVVELDPEDTSVGYGGLPNEDGVVQLDACVMYGPTHKCGSVMALENIKTPSSVARLVMERTDHIQLTGAGAKRFALMHGFKEENLLTDASRLEWLRWKENLSPDDDWLPPADGRYDLKNRATGTINVLGISASGEVVGFTTTSGLAWKISGRVGDSPIIGAGLYVDNEVGAAGATGRGEEVIRTCGSFFIVELMRAGKSPREACLAACSRIVEVNGGADKVPFNVKFVAVNKLGEVGSASIHGKNGLEPSVSYMNEKGFFAETGVFLMP
jgi:N4-(beta-N-acetylglucosaminyl)-L-asparaginase